MAPVGFEPTTSRLSADCVYASLVRARENHGARRCLAPCLPVNRLRANDQIAVWSAIYDVRLKTA